jgi:hypothetical protein
MLGHSINFERISVSIHSLESSAVLNGKKERLSGKRAIFLVFFREEKLQTLQLDIAVKLEHIERVIVQR